MKHDQGAVQELKISRGIGQSHRLYGQSLPLVRPSSRRGKANLILQLTSGQHRSVPRAATDYERCDQAARDAAALPRIAVRTILSLAQLVQSMLIAQGEDDDDAASCRTIHTRGSLNGSGPTAAEDASAAGMAATGSGHQGAAGPTADRADRPHAPPRQRGECHGPPDGKATR